MRELSDRQKSILVFVREHIDQHGYAPTVREIGDQAGLSSTSTVHRHLERLKEDGYLTDDQKSPRTLQVVSGTSPEKNIIKVIEELDDDVTEIVHFKGHPFLVKRASLEDIKEWASKQEDQ